MNDIQLISVDDIKEVTSISKSISPDLLEPYISISEEFYCYKILGDALTTELKNQLTGNSITSLNQTLLIQYIRPLAAFGAWLEASPFLNFKTVQKGVVKQSSDNSENVDLQEFNQYKQAIKDKVKFFQDRLEDYLNNNKSLYPLFRTTCSNGTNSYSNGIYLGSSN